MTDLLGVLLNMSLKPARKQHFQEGEGERWPSGVLVLVCGEEDYEIKAAISMCVCVCVQGGGGGESHLGLMYWWWWLPSDKSPDPPYCLWSASTQDTITPPIASAGSQVMSWVSMVVNPLLATWGEYTVPHSQFAVIIFPKSKFSLTSSHGWQLGSCDHRENYHVTTMETLSDYWEDYYASHVTTKEIIMWPHDYTEETPCDYWEESSI